MSSNKPVSSTSSSNNAGRGVLVITLAKGWFMLGGALITFGLPFIFDWTGGDGRALYGQYYDISNTLSIFSMVLIGGLLPTFSRFVAHQGNDEHKLLAMGKRLANRIGLLLLLIFSALSWFIAEWREHPGLWFAYICAGTICLSYAHYAVNVGFINGQQKFLKQAKLDICFTTMKVFFVLGAALFGFGVNGAFAGFATAALCIWMLSTKWLGPMSYGDQIPTGVIKFAVGMVLYTLVFNLSFKIDAFFIRNKLQAILSDPTIADQLLGEYGIAVSLSRLPWQATIALTLVIFPMLSATTFSNDAEKSRFYVQNTLRYALILITIVAAPLCLKPTWFFELLPKYHAGSTALVWLAPAYVFFSIANLQHTMLLSSGDSRAALLLMALMLILSALALHYGLSDISVGVSVLGRSAKMLLLSFAIATGCGAFVIKRKFGGYLDPLSILRCGIVLFSLHLIGNELYLGDRRIKILLLGLCPIVTCALLTMIKEIRMSDFQSLKRLVRRK